MDRDVAMTINGKLGAINTALQNIVNGIQNSESNNRSIPAGDQKSAPAEEPEALPEAEPEAVPEITTRKRTTSK